MTQTPALRPSAAANIYESPCGNVLSVKLLFADIFSSNGGKFSDEPGNRLVLFKPVPQVSEKDCGIGTFTSINFFIGIPIFIYRGSIGVSRKFLQCQLIAQWARRRLLMSWQQASECNIPSPDHFQRLLKSTLPDYLQYFWWSEAHPCSGKSRILI
jgi:hypothetical protein